MENYVGEIRVFAGNFAPVGWEFCNGQLVSISENDTLYYLLGTMYGGDGVNTFALPNLQSRAVVGMGQGPGLSNYTQGEATGSENVTLTSLQMPVHQHTLQGSVQALTGATKVADPNGAYYSDKGVEMYSDAPGTSSLATDAAAITILPAGGSQPHTNVQPTLAIRYIIAMQGIFPSQP